MKQVAILLALILCVIPNAHAKNTAIPQGLSVHADGFEFMEEAQRGMRVIPSKVAAATRQIFTGKSSSSSRSNRSGTFR